jgi:RNA polymerase sigma factor (TIGR02999 family)
MCCVFPTMGTTLIIDRTNRTDRNHGRGLTRILHRVHANQRGATDDLAEAIHDELRAMARIRLRKDFGPHLAGATIQPTMLANDTLMNLIRQRQRYDNSGHFFAIASRVMMRVLIDYHRSRNAQRRGGDAGAHVSIDDENGITVEDPRDQRDDSPIDLEALDAALARLEALDARKADVVRYRALWGLTMGEIAENLGVGLATVERDWSFAKTWLAKELNDLNSVE